MDEMATVNERMDTRIGNDLNLGDVRMDEIQEEVVTIFGLSYAKSQAPSQKQTNSNPHSLILSYHPHDYHDII